LKSRYFIILISVKLLIDNDILISLRGYKLNKVGEDIA